MCALLSTMFLFYESATFMKFNKKCKFCNFICETFELRTIEQHHPYFQLSWTPHHHFQSHKNSIADVAVRKRHQQLDEIRIVFTRTSFKSCFKKALSCNIRPGHFTQSISHSISLRTCYKCSHFTQRTLAWNAYVTGRKTTLLIPV